MPCTNRASAPSWMAHRWAAAPRPVCMKASLACGKTSSVAAAASVNSSIPAFKKCSRLSLGTCRSKLSIAPINKVEPSLIRTDADEVTYNLHVMLRFDFEMALLEGKLAVKDLPEAWIARVKQDIGISPPDDRDGVLQDVHWYAGLIGGSFQGYTLGNILGAQFYDTALQAHPEIPAEIRQGKFDTLHNWLIENIYQHGSKFTANELIERITGGPIRIQPYIRYLKTKYGELYNL